MFEYFSNKKNYDSNLETIEEITNRNLKLAIIALVTYFICTIGLIIGKKAGTKLAGKAGIFGGGILIFIGLEIFITSFF